MHLVLCIVSGIYLASGRALSTQSSLKRITFQISLYNYDQERPTPHYSMERHLNLIGCDTPLIWTYSQVGCKCCFCPATLHAPRSRYTSRVQSVNEYSNTCFSVHNPGTRKRTRNRKARKVAGALHALVLSTWLQELKMGKLLRHLWSAEYCHMFAAAPQVT